MKCMGMAGLCAAAFVLTATGEAKETFDGSVGSFTGNISSTLEHVAADGNPGGFLRVSGMGTTAACTQAAGFTGDLSRRGPGNVYVKFDTHVLLMQWDGALWVTIRKSPSVNAWTYVVHDFERDASKWYSFSVKINPNWTDKEAQAAGWSPPNSHPATFKETAHSVWTVCVQFVFPAGKPHVMGLDNFDVQFPKPVPRVRQKLPVKSKKKAPTLLHR